MKQKQAQFMKKLLFILIINFLLLSPSFAASKRSLFIKTHNKLSKKLQKLESKTNQLALLINSGSTDCLAELEDINHKQYLIFKALEKLNHKSNEAIESIKQELKTNLFEINSYLLTHDASSVASESLSNINSLQKDNNSLTNILLTQSKAKLFIQGDNSGIFGSVKTISGNCMPGIEINPSCKTEAKANAKIKVYEPIAVNDSFNNLPYLAVNAEPVLTMEANNSGHFAQELSPGFYSILVEETEGDYCNSYGYTNLDGQAELYACVIEIKADLKTEFNTTVDNASW